MFRRERKPETYVVSLRYTAAELDEIDRKAAKHKLSRIDMIRLLSTELDMTLAKAKELTGQSIQPKPNGK